MVIFQGLFYLGPAALLFRGCFKRPFLERLTHSSLALSASLRPAHLPNVVPTKAAESSKSQLSNFSLLVIGRNSLSFQVGGSELPRYPTSPKLDRAAVSCRPENFLGLKYSRPTEFSNMSCSPTFLDCHCI